MSSQPPVPLDDKANSDKEERILNASSLLFRRFGPKKTTIDDIAREAGLGKGTIYLYFKSKEDIFVAVAQRECDCMLLELERELEQSGSAEDCLRRVLVKRIKHLMSLVENSESMFEFFLEMRHELGMERIRHEFIRREAALLQRVLDSGVELGEFDCADTELTALTLLMCTAPPILTETWARGNRVLNSDEKIGALIQLVLNGIKRRAS